MNHLSAFVGNVILLEQCILIIKTFKQFPTIFNKFRKCFCELFSKKFLASTRVYTQHTCPGFRPAAASEMR
jgi:hypothetical protein